MSKGFNHIPNLMKEFPKAIEVGLTAVGMLVEDDAKLYCPVDTGALITDIKYIVDMSDVVVRIGTAVEYSPYVEFGTRKAAAQPFLRPAVDNNRENIKGCFESAANDAIKRGIR